MATKRYKAGELKRLHGELYDILGRVVEVCERLEINYFIIAGTAIGAHFEGDLLAWDDDIDLGMERDDYDRFLAESEALLAEGYILQTPLNEPNTPYYFAKVRKSGTRFEGDDELGLPIHHGIYIDIFPMDRVPNNRVVERIHRWFVRQLSNMFVAHTIPLRDGGAVMRRVVECVSRRFKKRHLYNMLVWVQTRFNRCETKYISIVKMPRDHIERATVHPTEEIKLGNMVVKIPRRVDEYLKWHYPNLRRYIPEDEQVNHAPEYLEFETKE